MCIFLIIVWCEWVHFVWCGQGHVFLDAIRKQAEKPWEVCQQGMLSHGFCHTSISSFLSWIPTLQSLQEGLWLKHASLHKLYPCPWCFWSSCFVLAIEILIKTLGVVILIVISPFMSLRRENYVSSSTV